MSECVKAMSRNRAFLTSLETMFIYAAWSYLALIAVFAITHAMVSG